LDDDEEDMAWIDLSADHPGLRVLMGKALQPEDPTNATTPVSEVVLVSTALPPSVRVTAAGGNQRCVCFFLFFWREKGEWG
jgi:hypothetical protein